MMQFLLQPQFFRILICVVFLTVAAETFKKLGAWIDERKFWLWVFIIYNMGSELPTKQNCKTDS